MSVPICLSSSKLRGEALGKNDRKQREEKERIGEGERSGRQEVELWPSHQSNRRCSGGNLEFRKGESLEGLI